MVGTLFSRNTAGEVSPEVPQQSLRPCLALIVLPLVAIIIANRWVWSELQGGTPETDTRSTQ
jgi:hypothetical protein